MVASAEADASSAASCDQATELTELSWPSSVERQRPVSASQILMVLSPEADASSAASCDQATELTQELWPSSVERHASHSFSIRGP